MKKNNTILFVFTLVSMICFSQSGKEYAQVKVSYGIDIIIDKTNRKYQSILNAFPSKATKIETINSEFDFTLVMNDSASLFYLEKKMFSDESSAELALVFSGYYGRIKQEPRHYITEELQEDFGKYLVIRPYQEWVMHEETKLIGEYLCFKATTSYTTTNPEGKIFKRNFTAWYTPQLPYKFGPAGYGNLPGLIVQLQGDHFTYGIKKVTFFSEGQEDKENKMPTLIKKKLITEEAFEQLAAEDEKRWLERNK